MNNKPVSAKNAHTQLEENKEDFEKDELGAWSYSEEYFIDVLNGDLSLEECRENLASFRNSEFYTGTNQKYKELL